MKKSIGFLFAMLIWIAVIPVFAQDDDGKLSYGEAPVILMAQEVGAFA